MRGKRIYQYDKALAAAGYKHKLNFNQNLTEKHNEEKKRRKRKVNWFNPPYNSAVATNIASYFLKLVDKYLKTDPVLYKYFNRNTIKVSYSCMQNMQSIIATKNKKLLGENMKLEEKGCNCRKNKNECPLGNKCLTECLVYKAEITSENTVKSYIGMASTSFKARFSNHKQSFGNRNQRPTSLSNYIWNLKDRGKPYQIKWSIQEIAPAFNQNTGNCLLCTSEKMRIMKMDKQILLNKRNEIFNKCPHRRRFLLGTAISG